MKHIGILLLCLCFQWVFSQESPRPSKHYQKDFDYLLELIEAHPNPYQYISKYSLDSLIESRESQIDLVDSDMEFYRLVAPIITAMRDGHSVVFPPRDVYEKVREDCGYFPYELHLTNEDQLYVLSNLCHQDLPIPNGAEIIEIEDKPTSEFLECVDPFISYESKPYRNARITERPLLHFYQVFEQCENIEMTYRYIDEKRVVVESLDEKKYERCKEEFRDKKEELFENEKPYEYREVAEGIALLGIYSFGYGDRAFLSFLDDSFDQMKRDSIHSLIIDLRDNLGGNPQNAARIFHYISQTSFRTMAMSKTKVSFPYRRSYLNSFPTTTNISAYRYLGGKYLREVGEVLNGPIGSMVEKDDIYTELPESRTNEFYGDVYCLINRKSFSAASSFAATFQCYQMGTLIGEPTGGTKVFNANAFWDRLPKTNIGVAMSSTQLFTSCYSEEIPHVMPDLLVQPSLIDLIHSNDSVLNFTIKYIRNVQKGRQIEREKAQKEKEE